MRRTIGSDGLDLLMDGMAVEGWVAVEFEPMRPAVDQSCSWRPLARRDGSRLIHCEVPVGHAFPDYFERRAWSSGIGARPGDVLLISDAAHREFVLTGNVEAAGRMIYVEEPVEAEPFALAEPLKRWRRGPSTSDFVVEDGEARDAERAIGRSIWLQLPSRSRPREDSEPDLLSWAVESSDLPSVRALSRALTRTTVLDGGCGSPGWLLAAARFLEACYVAALSRLTSFMIDEVLRGRSTSTSEDPAGTVSAEGAEREQRWRGVRTSFFADLGSGRGGPARVEIRGEIVRRQIVGLTHSSRDATSCRRVLLSYVGDPRPRFPSLDTNIHRDEWALDGVSTDGQGDGFLRLGPLLAGEAEADADAAIDPVSCFVSGWRLLLDARGRDQWSAEEWRRACRDLRRARHRVERRLARTGSRTATAALDPRLLGPEVQPGAFLVVRRK